MNTGLKILCFLIMAAKNFTLICPYKNKIRPWATKFDGYIMFDLKIKKKGYQDWNYNIF